MAFIDKKDPVVLNIKLTSKGRELLSEGKLDFKYFTLGDSEIDYNFNSIANLNPFYSNILRPVDKNPSILSFITQDLSGDTYNLISNVPSTPTIIQNITQPLGFFNISSGTTQFITDGNHVKQPDAMVKIDNIAGGTQLELFKAPTYLANVNEPSVGDFLLIKWTNKFDTSTGTTGYFIDSTNPNPILIYKIHDIVSGSLTNDNLIVKIDRELPDFSNVTGGTTGITAGALIYYNYINFTGNTIYNDYSTDYASEAVLTFLDNSQCSTTAFPFWNISIIYTDEIAGVQIDDRKYSSYGSKMYGGFVSYIQNQSPILKKLGVIHYTNSSPANVYGEELFVNIPDGYIPTIDLPTIMWHKSSTKTLGLKLKAYGQAKVLSGTTKSLNTNYYDLADLNGNIVGKIFTDLKLFLIEDQELLFAMSYKSNRSWTLPNYTVGTNDSVSVGCPVCTIDFSTIATNPTTINGGDGSIYVYDIINQIYNSNLILSISGETSGQVYFNPITGNTLVDGLSGDTYFVIIHDMGALNCQGKTITITNPSSLLNIYDTDTTQSGLNPDFPLVLVNPTTARIYLSDIGTIYGTGYTGVNSFGSLSPVTYNELGAYEEYNLSFLSPYTFYVKDVYTGTTEFIVTKDYVAAGSPFNNTFTISSQLIDSGGTYVIISNYLTTINPGINPIIGEIEFTSYLSTSLPMNWETLPIGEVNGSSMKLYINDGPNNYIIGIREKYQTIEMYKINKSLTIT